MRHSSLLLLSLGLVGTLGCRSETNSTGAAAATAGGSGGAAGSGGSGGSAATTGTGGAATTGTGGAATTGTGGAATTGTGGATTTTGTGGATPCTMASDCQGTDTECSFRTCDAGVCGTGTAPAGTALANQTMGDCLVDQCDGAGAIETVPDDADVADDGNACTIDTCSNGTEVHDPEALGTACGTGAICDGNKACVGCVVADDCAGVDDECGTRTCMNGMCGKSPTAVNTPILAQTMGDCQVVVCDGAGATKSVADDADKPADDTTLCTDAACTAGVPMQAPVSMGTSCTDSNGKVCDAAGKCVECNSGADCTSSVCTGGACQMAVCTDSVKNGMETGIDCGGPACPACPIVTGTSPSDTATGLPFTTKIAVTFNVAMNPATVTAATTSGPCTGSIQVSTDDFATCIGFAATIAVSGANTVFTLTPAPALSFGSTYKIQVTAAATDPKGNPVAAFTSGFASEPPGPLCIGNTVVINQVYGNGGNGGAAYKTDFIELHNRGSQAVDITGWSVQYTGATVANWAATPLTGVLQPGAYYLVAEGATGTIGANLPTPDATGTLSLSGTAGKIALVNNSTVLAVSCPTGPAIVDFLGYGTSATTGANCFEGASAAPTQQASRVSHRVPECGDTNNNGVDFVNDNMILAHNSATPASVCAACGDQTLNESGVAAEADACALQMPMLLNIMPGMTTGPLAARLTEGTVTQGTTMAPAGIVAQVGYGPDNVNPENQSGWKWFPAAFNGGFVDPNTDEFTGSFLAPATGKYRYTFRFSSNGTAWTYCDGTGAGSTTGTVTATTFEVTQLPVLLVP